MRALSLLLKNLLYVALVPGVVAGWLPLRVFERRAQWPESFDGMHFAGTVAALSGAAVFLQCTWILAVRGQGTPLFFDPPRKFTRRGPYKWVRNPMYLAFFAVVAGEGLFFRSWHIGVYFIFLVCALHLLVVLHEENALRFRFGAMYEDYRRDVPRWLPRKPKPVLQAVAPFEARR